MKGVTIINYENQPVLTGCNDCLGEDWMQGAFTYRWEGLKWINSYRRTHWSPNYKVSGICLFIYCTLLSWGDLIIYAYITQQIFWDLDGSLAGVKNSYVLQYYGFNDVKECSRLSVSVYGNSMLCVGNPVRRVEIRNVQPSNLRYTNLRIYGDTGKSDEVYFMPIDFDGWVIPVVTNHVSNRSLSC